MDRDTILDKAKIGVFTNSSVTFINSVLFSLKFEWDESIPTAKTDGISIFINPDWFMNECTYAQRIGLLLHEAWHVALEHVLRLGTKDKSTWNKACDYVVNNMLINSGFEIPKGGVHDSRYDNWSEEQIYYEILEEKKNSPKSNSFGDDLIFPEDNAKTEELKAKINETLVNAYVQTEMADSLNQIGQLPKSIQRKLQELISPQLPWPQLLQNIIQAKREDDYSWSIPDRRYYPLHLIMPSLSSEGLGSMNFYVDASGSTSDEDFARYIKELQYAVQVMSPHEISIAEFDTELKSVTVLQNHEFNSIGSIEFKGTGGTIINEVLDHIVETNPSISIIFTDGYFDEYYPKNLNQNIIWVIDHNPNFTYKVGRIVHINKE